MSTPNRKRQADGSRHKDRRRNEAQLRAANPHNQTPEQRLARLDQRLGKGQGAVKERARLAAIISG